MLMGSVRKVGYLAFYTCMIPGSATKDASFVASACIGYFTQSTKEFKKGDEVEALWHGSYWKAGQSGLRCVEVTGWYFELLLVGCDCMLHVSC